MALTNTEILIAILVIFLLLIILYKNKNLGIFDHLTIDPKYMNKYSCDYDLLGYKSNLFKNSQSTRKCCRSTDWRNCGSGA